MEKCIGCELCAGVCPADCIYVRGADNPPATRSRPGERYGFVYEINYLRCIHCDMCVEACPTEAITETKLFEFSFTNRSDAIYTKKELLVGDDGRPQHLPWEDWREGDDLHTSAWMRATSPSGSAAYEGGCSGRASWATGCGPPRAARADSATTPPPGSARSATSSPPTSTTASAPRPAGDHAGCGTGCRRTWRCGSDLRDGPRAQGADGRERAPKVAVVIGPRADAGRAAVLASATLVDRLTFGIGATIVILGAVGVVISRNPVHCAR